MSSSFHRIEKDLGDPEAIDELDTERNNAPPSARPVMAAADDQLLQVYDALFESHSWQVARAASRKERRECEYISMSLVYGEVSLQPFQGVVDVLKRWYHVLAKPGGVFLDIGSGSGRAVFAAVLAHDFDACFGIEILEGLHAMSQDVLTRWERVIKKQFPLSLQKKRTRIAFTHGDALEVEWPTTPPPDLVFLNSTCFGESLLRDLTRKLCVMCKPGAMVITATHPLADHGQHFDHLQHLSVPQVAWGDATWYLHRKK